MATGTPLFDHEGKLIYPVSEASVINSNSLKLGGNVEECLENLYEIIKNISLEGDAVNNLKIEAGYLKLKTKEQSEAELYEFWGGFELPDSDNPYLWKKTYYYYGDLLIKNTYEIVTVYLLNEEQTIYKAMNSETELPTIKYSTDVSGNPDYLNVDFHSLGWSDTPVSISASDPFVYMATRKKVDGLWEPFSAPVMYGRYAFDSRLEIKYATSEDSTPPALNAESTNPGDNWNDTNSGEFKYLWIITATSVNNALLKKDKIIWSGPNLISIVK